MTVLAGRVVARTKGPASPTHELADDPDVWPAAGTGERRAEPPSSAHAAQAAEDGEAGGVPPLDWSGELRIPLRKRELWWVLRPLLLVPGVPGVAWVLTGDHRVLLASGLGTAALVMRYDRRRTAAHRWSTSARAGRGRRRTDAERLQDMAAVL